VNIQYEINGCHIRVFELTMVIAGLLQLLTGLRRGQDREGSRKRNKNPDDISGFDHVMYVLKEFSKSHMDPCTLSKSKDYKFTTKFIVVVVHI